MLCATNRFARAPYNPVVSNRVTYRFRGLSRPPCAGSMPTVFTSIVTHHIAVERYRTADSGNGTFPPNGRRPGERKRLSDGGLRGQGAGVEGGRRGPALEPPAVPGGLRRRGGRHAPGRVRVPDGDGTSASGRRGALSRGLRRGRSRRGRSRTSRAGRTRPVRVRRPDAPRVSDGPGGRTSLERLTGIVRQLFNYRTGFLGRSRGSLDDGRSGRNPSAGCTTGVLFYSNHYTVN